jgi:hypothetical protein
MLVDVVPLRCRGVKRPRPEVLAATPVRGLLQLSAGRPGWYPGKRNAPLLAGLVVPGSTMWALEPLDHAQVTKIRNGSMLITGIEEIQAYRHVDAYRQTWWCRVVASPSAQDVNSAQDDDAGPCEDSCNTEKAECTSSLLLARFTRLRWFDAERLQRDGKGLASSKVIPPRIRSLEREVLARGRDRPLRSALEFAAFAEDVIEACGEPSRSSRSSTGPSGFSITLSGKRGDHVVLGGGSSPGIAALQEPNRGKQTVLV